MALPKSERKVVDMKAEERWKSFIRSEEDSTKNWQNNWGWIMKEYGCLEKTLKEKSEQSKFLTQMLKDDGPVDTRKLTKFPETTNHEYGWIADHNEFKLEKFGSDIFVASRLPDIYNLPNTK